MAELRKTKSGLYTTSLRLTAKNWKRLQLIRENPTEKYDQILVKLLDFWYSHHKEPKAPKHKDSKPPKNKPVEEKQDSRSLPDSLHSQPVEENPWID